MKGEAASGARTILEYLIMHLQYEKEELSERFSTLEGSLVISLDVEDSLQHINQSHCATIISAKGDFCHKLLSDVMLREIKGLLPFCQRGILSGRGCPHESLQTMPFQLFFQLCDKSDVLKEDFVALKQFIHRISLVHTMIKFHYCVKVNGTISAETYSTERKVTTCLPDGTRLLTDGRHFMRSERKGIMPSCDKIHLVTGDPVGLFIPDEVAERGFMGELTLMPVVSLSPCQKSFPNLPAKITAVYTARPEVQYDLHTSHPQDHPDVLEQTLLLFLFLGDRRVILTHLSPILFCSEQAVKKSIQGVVNKILEQHYKVFQKQQTLAHSLPMMATAISKIVSSSTDGKFRRKCLQSLQVADTQELQETVKETLNKIILQQWKPSRACEIKKPLPGKDKARQLSTYIALPSHIQKHSGSCVTGLKQEGRKKSREANGPCSGLLLPGSELGERSKTKKRKPTEDPEEGESDDPESKAKDKKPPSAFSCSPETGRNPFSDKSQGNSATPTAEGSRDLCQTDELWRQQVLNLARWTP